MNDTPIGVSLASLLGLIRNEELLDYEDLMLWCFEANRDEVDFRDGNYIYPVNPEEGTMEDPEYYFEECDFPVFGDLNARGLRTIDGKLYWVYKISRNIYTDKEVFISSLCCYDFTDSLKHLLPLITADGMPCVRTAEGETEW